MRKHRFVLVGVALLLTASGLVTLLLWPRDGPVSRARCERVQVGMTLEEVEAVLGGPPGNYSTGVVEIFGNGCCGAVAPGMQDRLWQSDDSRLCVTFDKQGRVVDRRLWSGRRVTYLDKLRVRLGL